MKLYAFTVRDTKAAAFAHPFFTSTPGLAIRQFQDWCNDKTGIIGQHPEDFHLYQIGQYDDNNARFENLDAPELLITGDNTTTTPRSGIREAS